MSGRKVAVNRWRRPPYPALRAFCRGYLHEDALVEHGSAAGAVSAFRAVAAPGERRALAADWRRFASKTAGWAIDRVAEHFRHELGAAWQPRTRDDLVALDTAIARLDDARQF